MAKARVGSLPMSLRFGIGIHARPYDTVCRGRLDLKLTPVGPGGLGAWFHGFNTSGRWDAMKWCAGKKDSVDFFGCPLDTLKKHGILE